ncbi:cytochrome c oxidase subunit I [Roseicyclus mahoneyensis]|uniref:cytochrome-c oxidase n=1 Tax=Roseicyclus mahoneyensis TaxID=164332 RepID=A0A316H267_9RHOB|nr:cytochrome c oxidase subunit I [Roseicyclus mahoneyensis]PWK61451.1 cytochrome c oxidase subunit I+III [Roseicyclus mahoneyensis]
MTAPMPATSPIRLHKALTRIWATGPGWQRLAAVNHSVVGIRFMVTAAVFFAIGGMLAMLIRAQLATPGSAFLGPEIYNQIFTMHGTIMMFLFAIPMLEGLALYMLPKMLGARDLAFPRLSAYGYWCYLFGGMILIGALVAGVAPQSGWFMYTPLSSDVYSPGINADVWLLGVTFVEISALTMAVELTVSILKLRAPGMTLARMPIFAWYILVTALMMVVGFPPLILGSILLEMERAFGLPFFDPERGGDPLLWQHLFWLFGHPEVYIIFLPAAGALSTMIPTFAQRPLVGYRAVVASIIVMAFLSFGIWVHHMFTTGIPHLALAFFSLGSALVAVPTAVQMFAWLATLAHGRPRWDVPMLYIFGFIAVFVCGGLTGVMLAMVPFNWQAHDSYFVVAHFHYVLVGGFVFPMLAALYYWMPHVTGRLSVHRLSVPAFWMIFAGFNVTFLTMHLTGLLGMPRRVYTYLGHEGWTGLNLLSSVGSFVLTMGFALIAADIFLQRRFAPRFRRDPWRAGTLEWATPTPPAAYGFASLPRIDVRADSLSPFDIGQQLAAGEGYLGMARNGWQETLGVDITTAEPDQIVILPRPTYLPLILALVTGVAVLSMLFKVYVLAILAAIAVAGLFVWGARSSGQPVDHGPLPIGHGLSAPPHPEAATSPPVLAMGVTLIADGAFFTSLIFGVIYLWLVAPNWPPPEVIEAGLALPLIVAAGLVAGPIAARGAAAALRGKGSVMPWLSAQAVALLTTLAALVWLIAVALPDPQTHGYAAASFALLAYVCLHLGIAGLFVISNANRLRSGHIAPRRDHDLRLTRAWQDFTALSGLIAVGFVVILPWLVTG